jgi:thymidylate synthase
MKAYTDILRDILENGEMKGNRTGIRTLMLPCLTFRHNMQDGFPLLTTRKLPIRSTLVELEGFIGGITSKKWYKDRKCKYWNEWANPEKVSESLFNKATELSELIPGLSFDSALNSLDRKYYQEIEDDLGPVYGYQWRRFNQAYDEDDSGSLDGYDQLLSIVNKLKSNPDDRRMVCSAWNPNQLDRMALPPCHMIFTVIHTNGKLSLSWKQRSVDSCCGLPANIASYATLLLLLCKIGNFKPWILKGDLDDCHIYENHIENAKIQIERKPLDLPELEITSPVDKPFDIFEWTHKDVQLTNYNYHPALKFEVAV